MKKNKDIIRFPSNNCAEDYSNTKERAQRKIINIDMDGTICHGKFWEEEPIPDEKAIREVRRLYMEGHVVIIWSARLWENASMTIAWLIKHRVPFHGIMLGKGSSDVYVDDKSQKNFKNL